MIQDIRGFAVLVVPDDEEFWNDKMPGLLADFRTNTLYARESDKDALFRHLDLIGLDKTPFQ